MSILHVYQGQSRFIVISSLFHVFVEICATRSSLKGLINRAPMAQLVEHWVVTREVVSSTPAGPTLRVLKYLRNKCYLCNYMVRLQVFSVNPRPRLTVPSMFKMSTWDVKEPPHHSKRVRRKFPRCSKKACGV